MRALRFPGPIPASSPPTAGDDLGAVLVEYTAVFAFVSILVTIAIVKLGPALLDAWSATQAVILAAKP